MFKKMTQIALNRNKAVYFLLAILVLFGGLFYTKITKSIFPNVKFPYVSVYTEMAGASSNDMEEMITNKIEEELKDLEEVKEIRSTSSMGSSLVIVKFNEKANVDIMVQKVQVKVNNIRNRFPSKAEIPVVEEYDIAKFPVIAIEIPNTHPYVYTKAMMDELTQAIKGITGVTKVEKAGLKVPRLQIDIDAEKLSQYNLTAIEIYNILEKAQVKIPLGKKEMNNLSYSFESDNTIYLAEEVEKIFVKHDGDQVVTLGDIAKIDYIDKIGKNRTYQVKGEEKKEIINLLIYIDKKADTISINQQIRHIVEVYNVGQTKENQVEISMDLSKYIQKSIQDVINNALSGLLAVIVVLFFFINMEEAVVASLVIPISLIGSFVLFNTFNITLNIFSIMGMIIALGMLVDNAIVVIEMIDDNKQNQKDLDLQTIIIASTSNVAPAIFSSTLTTICAFIPLAFLSGEEGSVIKVIPITMSIAMVVSFLVSITLTPLLCYHLVKRESPAIGFIKKIIYITVITVAALFAFSNNWEITRVSIVAGIIAFILSYYKLKKFKTVHKESFYQSVISKIIGERRNQIAVIAVTLMMFMVAGMLFSFGKIKTESMPKVDSQSISGTVRFAKGTTFEASNQCFEAIFEILKANESINRYSCTFGDALLTYYIELKPKNLRKQHSTMFIEEISKSINEIPGITAQFMAEGDEAETMPLSIWVYGNNQKQLMDASQTLQRVIGGISGVLTSTTDFNLSEPTVKLTIDNEKASQKKVDPSEVMFLLRLSLINEKATTIKMNDLNTDVYVHINNLIDAPDALLQLSVVNADGVQIPLAAFAKITEERGISEIRHVNNKRTITVNASIDSNYTVGEIVSTFEKMLEKQDLLPTGVTYKVAGDFVKMQDSYKDLTEKFMIAIILVYFVLLVQFNGFFQPFVIIICVPFAIIGVAFGYCLMGLKFSTLSFLGVVSLVGIAVNDAIVMIDYINSLRADGMERKESIIKGCNARFKPIIATSITTIAGVLPLALFNEDYSQMAYALVFGLIGSTFLTLVVVPSMLNLVESLLIKSSGKEKVYDKAE